MAKQIEDVPTRQARDAIAQVFEGIGGIKQMIAWARTHQAQFYTSVYPKLIPVTLAGTVDLNAKSEDDTAHAALERILHGLIDERKREESTVRNVSNDGHGIVIDVVANPPAPPPPPTPTPNAADHAAENVVHIKRAVDNDPPRRAAEQPPAAQYPQPAVNATIAFYEYFNSGGGRRVWWGPTGEGGPP
jgi:hypothetical protein